MDRRSALGLAAMLPAAALASTRAAACSIAVDPPEVFARRVPMLADLFKAWFARDEIGFLGVLHGPRNTNGVEPTEDIVRRYIAAAEDREPARLYETLFTDPQAYRGIEAITSIGNRAFVAVSEQMPGGIGPDCSNMPVLHLFLVGLEWGRPATLRLIESETWSGYGGASTWTA